MEQHEGGATGGKTRKPRKTKERIKVEGLVLHQTQARSCPKLVCQACNEFIDDADSAIFVWNPKKSRAQVLHRTCSLTGRDPADWVLDVGTMLVYLMWNLGLPHHMSLKKWEERARSLAQV
ncbi:MAG: hypothetical protein ACOC58_00725 [Chloroflexota bacterium]